MNKPRLGAIAAALLVAGCSFVPTYERPSPPVAPTFVGQAAQGAELAVSDLEWRSFFRDERLRKLVELALQNNRDLRVAVLSIEQTRAQLQLRHADELPTVNAGMGLTRGPNSAGATVSTTTAGLTVTAFELDLFGRVRALSQAAQAQLLGTEEARKTVQMSLIAAVASTYLSLLADDELLRITRGALATRAQSLKLTQLKYDNEAASKLDLVQAQSLLESAKVALAQFTRQRALDENALVLLLGQPMPANLPHGKALLEQELMPDLPAGLPAEVLVHRPDIRQAEQSLLASNANIGAARAAFFPRITLTGSAGVVSNDLESLFGNGSSAWTFVPQLLLPLFDAGRNQANLDATKVARDIAVAQYEKAIQTGFREVSDALASRASLSEQLRAQAAQLDAEKTRMQLVDLRLLHGAANYFDLLDAQRSLFAAQQALMQVQVQQLQNLVTMYKVLGGGWK